MSNSVRGGAPFRYHAFNQPGSSTASGPLQGGAEASEATLAASGSAADSAASQLQASTASLTHTASRMPSELSRACREGAKAQLILELLDRLKSERNCPADACVPRFEAALHSFISAMNQLRKYVHENVASHSLADARQQEQASQLNLALEGLNNDLSGLLQSAAKSFGPTFTPPRLGMATDCPGVAGPRGTPDGPTGNRR